MQYITLWTTVIFLSGIVLGVGLAYTINRSSFTRLLKQAYHDELTGLPRRKLFEEFAQASFARADRRRTVYVGVFLIDVDGFKQVNDTCGHKEGDKVLCIIAQKLKSCTRRSDTVARIGGDEFVALIETSNRNQIELTAKKIVERMSFIHIADDNQFRLSVSVGVAVYSEHGKTIDSVLEKADDAMYESKNKNGGNTYRLFGEKPKAILHSV